MKKQFFLTIAVIAVLAAGVITLSAFSNVKKEIHLQVLNVEL